jgi:hypothetical protein
LTTLLIHIKKCNRAINAILKNLIFIIQDSDIRSLILCQITGRYRSQVIKDRKTNSLTQILSEDKTRNIKKDQLTFLKSPIQNNSFFIASSESF